MPDDSDFHQLLLLAGPVLIGAYLHKESKKPKPQPVQTQTIEQEPSTPFTFMGATPREIVLWGIGLTLCLGSSYLLYRLGKWGKAQFQHFQDMRKKITEMVPELQSLKSNIRWLTREQEETSSKISAVSKSIETLEDAITNPHAAGAEVINATVSEIIKGAK
jgi:hypothetical protein